MIRMRVPVKGVHYLMAIPWNGTSWSAPHAGGHSGLWQTPCIGLAGQKIIFLRMYTRPTTHIFEIRCGCTVLKNSQKILKKRGIQT